MLPVAGADVSVRAGAYLTVNGFDVSAATWLLCMLTSNLANGVAASGERAQSHLPGTTGWTSAGGCGGTGPDDRAVQLQLPPRGALEGAGLARGHHHCMAGIGEGTRRENLVPHRGRDPDRCEPLVLQVRAGLLYAWAVG